MTRFSQIWALTFTFCQWISLSSQYHRCDFGGIHPGGNDIEVVFESSNPNTTAPPDYFYEQLRKAQYEFFLNGSSPAFKDWRPPQCQNDTYQPSIEKKRITMNLKNMLDTSFVMFDGFGDVRVINESASMTRQIWLAGFKPLEHYREATGNDTWREVLKGLLETTIFSWKNDAPDLGLLYHWEPPELTMERVQSVIYRFDACIEDPEKPSNDGRCNNCCGTWDDCKGLELEFPWYCGWRTLDDWTW